MKRIKRVILYILLFLLVLFFARGPFYGENTLVSRIVLILFLGISSLYLLKSLLIRDKGSTFYYYWLILLSLNIIGFTFTGTFSNPLHSAMFVNIIIAMLPFFPFYYFSKKGILREKHLRWFLILILPMSIVKYYYNEIQILTERAFSVTDITNNVGYYFTALIPFLFFFRKKKFFSYILLFILFFYIISSAKRGAILVGVIGMLCFLYYQLRAASKKELYTTIILVLIVTFVSTYYGYEYIQSNDFLTARFEATIEGESSGRDIIYKNIFNTWSNTSSIRNILFGFGFASSVELSASGQYAHNDWLELLSNFGLFGVLIYGLLLNSLYSLLHMPSISIERRMLLITLFSMWFITSIFSMVYNSTTTAIYSLLLGYLIGSEDNKYKKIT